MARSSEATTSIDADPDLASARLAAINQSPDAQDRNTFQEHPMNAYARNLLSPMNYQSQVPQGFNAYAAPQPPDPTSFGNTERAGIAQPYNPDAYAPGPFDFQGSNQGISGQTGYDISKAISEVPVVGGALNYLSNTVARGPLMTGLGMNPDVNAAAAKPGANLNQIQRDYWDNAMSNAAMGAAGALEGQAGKAALAGRLARGAQGADQTGIASKLIQGSGAALTKDAARAASDAADAAAGRIPTTDVSTAPAPGMTRLYRAESTTGVGPDSAFAADRLAVSGLPRGSRYFSSDPGVAKAYTGGIEAGSTPFTDRPGSSRVVSVDVPTAELSKYRPANAEMADEFVLPKELYSQARPVPPTTAELQAASDAFNQAASTTAEVAPKRPAIQTAEGQALNPSVMTRALQTAAGSEGTPLSQHPVFSAYGKGGAKVGPQGAVGGDIGTATRAVMSGDAQAMELLGPDLTQQLIQNKVAHVMRQTGVPEDVVRIGLSVMTPAERATAEPIAIATVGRNAKLVDETLAAVVAPPKSLLPDEVAAARQGLADRMGVDPKTGLPLGGEGVPPTPPRGPSGGATPPSGPPPVSRVNYGQVAGDVFDEVNALWRATLAGADVSTVGLQGAPLIVKELTKLPFYAVTGKFGGTQRPYIQTAFARFFQAAVAGESKMNQMTQGFMDQAEKLGLRVGKDIQISDPLGGISAREELTAGKIIQKLPGIGLLYRQANFATITLLNALRIGEVTNLKRAFDGIGLAWDAERAGHLANITTGRGDLPGMNGENADAIARWAQRIFFGPRLATSAVQNVTDTILSLRNVTGQIAGRKPLNPIDVSRIHTTASFVATGVGVMKLAEASGLQIGTDPEATDFGRITLPGGHRLDFWGPFNEEARLIARELSLVGGNVASAVGLRPDVKPKYGAQKPEEILMDYITGKFGPAASGLLAVAEGKNKAGQTPQQVIQSTIANPNPLSNPTSIVPAPFTAQTAAAAFDPAQGGQGGAQGLTESALGALGFSVLPANQHINYDGFGRAEGSKGYGQDAVFDEYLKFHPGVLLPAPDSVLGSGHNTFPLPAGQREAYVQAIGDQRRIDLGNLIYSDEYQNATKAQQEKMFSSAMTKADATANKKYLKDFATHSTDASAVRAAAVTGFHAQGNAKDEAYWIATLDKAGKLTPDVKQAIEDSNVTLAGQRAPITVDEYLRHAPLIHEYLAHVPFGTDKSPIGGPADWSAVAQAIKAKANRVDELVRAGTAPSLADAKAQQEILKMMPSMVQRNLFLNGAQLENPARKVLATKYPTLKKFVSDPKAPKEDTNY